MSEIKLKRCPFCGGEVQYHSWSHTMENFFNKNTIICPTCDFAMEDVSEIRLIKKWNTRKPMQEIMEKLEEEKTKKYNDWNKTSHFQDLGGYRECEYIINIVKQVVGGINK